MVTLNIKIMSLKKREITGHIKIANRVQESKLRHVVYQDKPFVMGVHSPMLRVMLHTAPKKLANIPNENCGQWP